MWYKEELELVGISSFLAASLRIYWPNLAKLIQVEVLQIPQDLTTQLTNFNSGILLWNCVSFPPLKITLERDFDWRVFSPCCFFPNSTSTPALRRYILFQGYLPVVATPVTVSEQCPSCRASHTTPYQCQTVALSPSSHCQVSVCWTFLKESSQETIYVLTIRIFGAMVRRQMLAETATEVIMIPCLPCLPRCCAASDARMRGGRIIIWFCFCLLELMKW